MIKCKIKAQYIYIYNPTIIHLKLFKIKYLGVWQPKLLQNTSIYAKMCKILKAKCAENVLSLTWLYINKVRKFNIGNMVKRALGQESKK